MDRSRRTKTKLSHVSTVRALGHSCGVKICTPANSARLQRAVEAVTPTVIGTTKIVAWPQCSVMTAAACDGRREEGSQLVVLTSDNHDRLTRDVGGEVVAACRLVRRPTICQVRLKTVCARGRRCGCRRTRRRDSRASASGARSCRNQDFGYGSSVIRLVSSVNVAESYRGEWCSVFRQHHDLQRVIIAAMELTARNGTSELTALTVAEGRSLSAQRKYRR